MEQDNTTDVRLSVSIVLYNSPLELLLRTLDSLALSVADASRFRSIPHVDVHIIDNSQETASRDETRSALAKCTAGELLNLRYIENGENSGFGAGHNKVLDSLDSTYHLILNPDAELAEETVEAGIACMLDEPGTVLLSPQVWSDGGHQEFLCKRYPSVLVLLLRAFAPRFVRWFFRRRLHHYEMRDACASDQPSDVLLASGCFMLVSTAALQEVGGFDERYFLYFEDFDLSLKLGAKGRKVYHPDMKIVHHGGYAARKGMLHVKLFVRSGIQFFRSHGWRWI
ncbi:MAG: glycosyltransferase family 2 protein [Halioglobus sp.]